MTDIDYAIGVGDLLKTALAVAESRIDRKASLDYSIIPQELSNGRTCKVITFKIYLYETTNGDINEKP